MLRNPATDQHLSYFHNVIINFPYPSSVTVDIPLFVVPPLQIFHHSCRQLRSVVDAIECFRYVSIPPIVAH